MTKTKAFIGVHLAFTATIVTLFCGFMIADAVGRATGGGE